MKNKLLIGMFSMALFSAVAQAETIGEVSTSFKMLGANNKIVIEAFDDPDVHGATCYLSRAKTGGIAGSLGIAEDTSDASISCREEGWGHHCNSMDDYDSFVSQITDFNAGEFGEFKVLQEVDDQIDENSHAKKMIFSWKGKFYEFLYDRFSYQGYDFGNYPNPLSEVEPITETIQRYVYQ